MEGNKTTKRNQIAKACDSAVGPHRAAALGAAAGAAAGAAGLPRRSRKRQASMKYYRRKMIHTIPIIIKCCA